MPLKDVAHMFGGGGVKHPQHSLAMAIKKRKKITQISRNRASLEPVLSARICSRGPTPQGFGDVLVRRREQIPKLAVAPWDLTGQVSSRGGEKKTRRGKALHEQQGGEICQARCKCKFAFLRLFRVSP